MGYQESVAKIQAFSPETKASFEKAASTIKAQGVTADQPNPSPLQDNRDSNQAYRQNQSNQDTAAPALSPTDRFNGRSSLDAAPVAAKTPAASQTPTPMPTPSVSQGSGGRGR